MNHLYHLGITDSELKALQGRYEIGQQIWRVLIKHLTPYDCNFPYGPPPCSCGPGDCDNIPGIFGTVPSLFLFIAFDAIQNIFFSFQHVQGPFNQVK